MKKTTNGGFQLVEAQFSLVTYASSSSFLQGFYGNGVPNTILAHKPNFSVTFNPNTGKLHPIMNLESPSANCFTMTPATTTIQQTISNKVVSTAVSAALTLTSGNTGTNTVINYDAATWVNRPDFPQEWDPCHLSTNYVLEDAISNYFFIETGGYAKEIAITNKAFAEPCTVGGQVTQAMNDMVKTWKLNTIVYWSSTVKVLPEM